MKVGIQLIFQGHKDYTDADMYKNELRLAIEADNMGYDALAVVEHHFDSYSISPDNAQTLSYLAAKTKKIKMMTSAFILPWNDPLRVVEKIILLDILSEGRAVLGMARGLARMEFEGFRVKMAESRERFDEAAEMIIRGLETGFVENDGRFFKQPRVEVRPRAPKSFVGRMFMVGMSPQSVDVAGRLGLGCLKFSNFPWEEAMPEINAYRAAYRNARGIEAPPINCADFIAMSKDHDKAHNVYRKYIENYWHRVMEHYEMKKVENFNTANGSYDSYIQAANELNAMSHQEALDMWCGVNLVGTPEEIIERLETRRNLIGDFDLTLSFSSGHAPYDVVWEQMKLFTDEVMPVIKSWDSKFTGVAAAQ